MKAKIITISMLLVLLAIAIPSQDVYAADWYKGSLHQHTGFSASAGYDEDPDIDGPEGCYFPLEGHPDEGRNIPSIVPQAKGFNHSWIAITDHTYCLNSTEFNVVKTDCSNAQHAGTFACLAGTRLKILLKFKEMK